MSAGGSGANAAVSSLGESSVPAVCTVLEDLGYTIKRCCDPEEAVSRARDLQAEKQLRCIIVGGDEQVATCGNGCSRPHSGICVR
jgi:hypothetical protein